MKYFYNKRDEIVICRIDDKIPTTSTDLRKRNLVRYAGCWHTTRQNRPLSVAYFKGFVEVSKSEANRICKENYKKELENAKNNNKFPF